MIEIYARLLDMAQEAECPGRSAHERMRYLVELAEKHGLEFVATQPRVPADHPGKC